MVKLIIGRKGSGKTKKIVDLANAAVSVTKGNVVFIEKGNALTFSVSSAIRLIDTSEYKIGNYQEFYGFVAGIMASDYDATEIFVDGTKKIGGDDVELFAEFVEKLAVISTEASPDIIMTVSYNAEELPEAVKKYVV